MMNNLVIKVNGELNPKNDDILVYNSSKGVWEVQTKQVFLNDINKKVKDLNKKIDDLKKENDEKFTKINNNISKMAKIMKKEIK